MTKSYKKKPDFIFLQGIYAALQELKVHRRGTFHRKI